MIKGNVESEIVNRVNIDTNFTQAAAVKKSMME